MRWVGGVFGSNRTMNQQINVTSAAAPHVAKPRVKQQVKFGEFECRLYAM